MTARWMTRWKPAVGFASVTESETRLFKIGVDIIDDVLLQRRDVDITSLENGRGIAVIDESEKQMFECGVLMPSLVCQRQRLVQGLFEVFRK